MVSQQLQESGMDMVQWLSACLSVQPRFDPVLADFLM